ncbi:uncharacterized protein B0T23DRAFT_404135 [Neurospora hispaniola]|uniref:Uncharacterized protein n=1 Tax=Neurospora hispaniola TaxID=588809 RepID=A0AAJ0MT44_9PEZI|nr:hypothetical protein B0T23DRAFT_404135 [Neurospora hispaniola]
MIVIPSTTSSHTHLLGTSINIIASISILGLSSLNLQQPPNLFDRTESTMKFSILPSIVFLAFTTGALAAPKPILINARQNSQPPLTNPNPNASLQPFLSSTSCSGPPSEVLIPVSYATLSPDTTVSQGCYEFIDNGVSTPVQSVRITGVWPEANKCLLRFYEEAGCAAESAFGTVAPNTCGGFVGGRGIGSYQVVCQST